MPSFKEVVCESVANRNVVVTAIFYLEDVVEGDLGNQVVAKRRFIQIKSLNPPGLLSISMLEHLIYGLYPSGDCKELMGE